MSKLLHDKTCNNCSHNSIRHRYKGNHSKKKRKTWSGAYSFCATCQKSITPERRFTRK